MVSLSPLPGTLISNLPITLSLIGNELIPCVQAGTTKTLTPNQLGAFVSSGGSTVIVTSAGTVDVSSGVATILVNKTVPSSTALSLPTTASRNGLPLHVSDVAGTGGDMVLTADAGDTEGIMGLPTLTVGSGGVPGSGGFVTIYPNATIGGWYL